MGLFTDLFSVKPAEEAAKAKQAGLNTANINAGADLTAGQANADQLFGQAQAPYTGLMDSTGRGSAAYGDATGANGAEGLARAKALFQSDPGYSGGLNTGIDAATRKGLITSPGGNTAADVIKFASDYDANKYGNYVSNLSPYLGANQSAISGNAGVLGSEAGANLGVASTKATNDYNTAAGIGNAKADAALAPYSASSNFWGALTGLGSMALKATGVGGYAPSLPKTA